MVFEDFDGDDVAGALFPALHHLTEGSATEKFKNLKKSERKMKNFAFRTFNWRTKESN